MEILRFIKQLGGGGVLSLFRGFSACSKFKICYNGDVINHYYKEFIMLKKGFTLSEVLITLGIIGVVAAMTLPVLISRYQERQWTTAYLRVYSLLENAYRMAQNEHGTFENWAGVTLSVSENDGGTDRSMADGMAIYNTMIKPYLKLNDVSFSYGVNDDYESTCMSGSQLYSLANEDMPHDYGFPIVSLASGECISLGDRSADFWVDLNGKKKPNTLGKDIFMISFDVVTRERLKPGYMDRWWTDVPQYCNRETSSGSGWTTGTSCGFWILRHHNMDYLHLPYEEVKKKWNGGWW